MQKEEGEKLHLHHVVLRTQRFLKFYRGAILLYESLPETLKRERSEGEHINCSVIMKFHDI